MANEMETRVTYIYIYMYIYIYLHTYVYIAYKDYAGIHSGMEKNVETTIRCTATTVWLQ